MKELSQLPQSQGVCNAATADMRDNLDEFLSKSSDDNMVVFESADGIGKAREIGTLQTRAASATTGRQTFDRTTCTVAAPYDDMHDESAADRSRPLGEQAIDLIDPELIALLGLQPTKSKQGKREDDEMKARKSRAARKMEREGISPDPVTEKKSRCAVCNKLWTFKYRDLVPHSYVGSAGAKGSTLFCPLADDHSILKDHLAAQEEKRRQQGRERLRRLRDERKKRKSDDLV